MSDGEQRLAFDFCLVYSAGRAPGNQLNLQQMENQQAVLIDHVIVLADERIPVGRERIRTLGGGAREDDVAYRCCTPSGSLKRTSVSFCLSMSIFITRFWFLRKGLPFADIND